jgi:DnaJ family protein C protein 7
MLPTEAAFYTNRAIAYMKLNNFDAAKRDCQQALNVNPQFGKGYNRLSKCYIGLGDLVAASIALQKSMELDKNNETSKRDKKYLADLKITDTLVNRAISEEKFDKAVTNLNALLKDCTMDVDRVCLKLECLCKSYQFEEANKYSADVMKTQGDICNHPRILCWRGKVLVYNGNEALGKKHFTQALNFDPDLKECQKMVKQIKHSNLMKEEATALFKIPKYDEAMKKFQECLEIDPLNANYNAIILFNMSVIYDKQGK